MSLNRMDELDGLEQIQKSFDEGEQANVIIPKREEEEEGTPWLMSFADMVTLLMCFFILFFSMADPSATKTNDIEVLTQKLQVLLGYADDSALSKTESNELDSNEKNAESSGNSNSTNNVDVAFAVGYSQPDTVEIVLLSKSLFRSGSVEISTNGKRILMQVTREIALLAPDSLIEIEGHTDSDPIKGGKYRSNWELSTSRAASVAHELIANEFSPEKIKVAGFAHYKPLADEFDSKGHPLINNKALNRRIVLKVRRPKDPGVNGDVSTGEVNVNEQTGTTNK